MHGIWQAVAVHTPQRLATINQMHACLEVGLMLTDCCLHRSIAFVGNQRRIMVVCPTYQVYMRRAAPGWQAWPFL